MFWVASRVQLFLHMFGLSCSGGTCILNPLVQILLLCFNIERVLLFVDPVLCLLNFILDVFRDGEAIICGACLLNLKLNCRDIFITIFYFCGDDLLPYAIHQIF